jgi:hypothetical protein
MIKITEKDYYKPPAVIKNSTGKLYGPIPWPFSPFDSMRTVWNHYEQHMGYGQDDYSYLHQGLDIITPIGEPTYTVQQGVVKCVLTLGGAVYWRLAISPVQSSGRSNGWLYAHLIESTIPVYTGDIVELHEYIGDIVEWTPEWGHIHFVEITDSGSVWLYNDDEWGINFNPLLALEPVSDNIPPKILNSSISSKFEFCRNETSNYLNPMNISGEIDIIVRAVDYTGDSEWQQPAFKSEYWVRSLVLDSIVFPKKTGHILNHPYSMYSSASYEPYARVLYKRDTAHPAPFWMYKQRNFYHIITNNGGNEDIDTTDRFYSFDTRNFPDGMYRLYVEVSDPSGNKRTDSMDIKFVNGILSADDVLIPERDELSQNYPNPFNPSTSIKYRITTHSMVTIRIFDILGGEAALLLNREQSPGEYEITWDASGFPGGVYLLKMQAGKYSQTKKLLLVK